MRVAIAIERDQVSLKCDGAAIIKTIRESNVINKIMKIEQKINVRECDQG